MPGMSGLTATRTILGESSQARILMLSMHSEDTLVRQAIEAGARGYVLKNAVDLDLVAAVRRVAAGEIVLDPQVSRAAVLKGERNLGLTPRELEILQEWSLARVLMLSMHSEDTLVRQAIEAGARGYVLKNAVDLDLVAAVRKVAARSEERRVGKECRL